MWIIVHAAAAVSLRGPSSIPQQVQFARAGTQNSYIWANSQYQNPEYDAIINQMDGILPSPLDATTSLTAKAINFFLRDVAEITLAEERTSLLQQHVLDGWITLPTHTAPYSLWAPFELSFLKIRARPGQ